MFQYIRSCFPALTYEHEDKVTETRYQIWLLIRAGLRALGVLIILLILFEIFLRIFAPQYQRYIKADDLMGWRHRPNANYVFIPQENCPGLGSTGTVNSLGLIDQEYSLEPPADTIRILALGSSFTEALQFPAEQTWTNQLEIKLNEAADDDIQYEVINGGRAGSGATISYLYYDEHGQELQPDVVLLLFGPTLFTYDYKPFRSTNQPYYFLVDDELVLDTSFLKSRSYQLGAIIDVFRSNSYAIEFFMQAYRLWSVTNQEDDLNIAFDSPENDTEETSDALLTEDEANALSLSQQVILKLRDTVEANGSQFALIFGSTDKLANWQTADQWDQVESGLEFASGPMMRQFATENNLHYLDLVPRLREYALAEEAYVHGCEENNGTGHWSQPTHEVVAQHITDFMFSEDILP